MSCVSLGEGVVNKFPCQFITGKHLLARFKSDEYLNEEVQKIDEPLAVL